MAPLTTASRACLRGLAKSGAPSMGVRALSSSTAVRDSATSYSSPFKSDPKASKIPDWSKYATKGNQQLFSYFMVGALGAISAAGAKSTVQGLSLLDRDFDHQEPSGHRAA